MKRLEGDGKVGPGLTFHGLRHTVGTLLIEAGVELDIVRRWLGQDAKDYIAMSNQSRVGG
jgi:integrase